MKKPEEHNARAGRALQVLRILRMAHALSTGTSKKLPVTLAKA